MLDSEKTQSPKHSVQCTGRVKKKKQTEKCGLTTGKEGKDEWSASMRLLTQCTPLRACVCASKNGTYTGPSADKVEIRPPTVLLKLWHLCFIQRDRCQNKIKSLYIYIYLSKCPYSARMWRARFFCYGSQTPSWFDLGFICIIAEEEGRTSTGSVQQFWNTIYITSSHCTTIDDQATSASDNYVPILSSSCRGL